MDTHVPAAHPIAADPETGRRIAGGFLLFCLASLGIALILQYRFDAAPCILCLYQRVPYAIAALAAAVAYQRHVDPAVRRGMIGFVGVAMLAGAGLAFFHFGVEQYWWAGTSGCGTGGELAPITLEDLRDPAPLPVPCDQPSFVLFGLSLTAYNLVISLAAAGVAGYALMQKRYWMKP